MPDIHIGRSPYNKNKDLVKVNIFFHVPTNKGGSNEYPGVTPSLDYAGNPILVSSAPGVTAGELTSLQDATLVEVIQTKFYNLSLGVAAMKTAIRGLYADVASEKQTELDREYPFYGITLARA